MSILSRLFKPGVIRPRVGHRVRHVTTYRLGTVQGRAKISGAVKVWVLTVKYDDGQLATMVPENEFIAMGKAKPAGPQIKPQLSRPKELSHCLQCRRLENSCTCIGGPWLAQQ